MRKRDRKTTLTLEILKAARRQCRADEISAHGHPVSYNIVERSKKTYTRKVKHRKPLE